MNSEQRRRFNSDFLNILQNYISNFQEYQENVTDYNRNISRMMNIVANNSNISLTTNHETQNQPRRTNFEYDLLTYLLTTMNTPINMTNRGLTESVIETNTRMITYSDTMEESICPITHNPFESGEQVCQIIHCGHYFKREAIMRWFQTHNTCPTCRHVIRESRENDNINTNINNNINNSLRSGLDSFARIVNTNIQDPSFNTISYTFDIPFNNYNA